MIQIPKISPIAFRQDVLITTNRPKDLGGIYYGVDYVPICDEWLVDTTINLIILADAPPTIQVNGNLLLSIDITPVGWYGIPSVRPSNVYKTSYIPTVIGETTEFTITDGTDIYTSPIYTTVNNQDNSLIRIDYIHNEIDFGMFSGDVMTTFVYGEFMEALPTNEIVSFKNTRNQTIKLRATPIEAYNLKMYYLKYNDINKLNLIFSCSETYVNNTKVVNEEGISSSRVDVSDLFEANVTLERVDDNFMFIDTRDLSGVLIGDDNDNTISDDNETQLI